MRIAGVPGFLGALVLTASAVGTAAPAATAAACPDVEVAYARGTAEPVGIGLVGQTFVDALRAPTRSVDV